MARQTWVYKADGTKYLRSGARNSVGLEDFDSTLPFKERMRRNLYNLECKQGSKFRIPDYSKKQLQRVWNE